MIVGYTVKGITAAPGNTGCSNPVSGAFASVLGSVLKAACGKA